MPGKVYMLPGEVNERRKGGESWLHKVIGDKKEIGWVQALLEAGANVNARMDDGICPLLLAASVGNPDVVTLLLAHGAQINCNSYKGWTALRNAAAAGHFEVVKVLLDHGADCSIAGEDGLGPLELAMGNGHENVAKLLRQISNSSGEEENARQRHEKAVLLMDAGDYKSALAVFGEVAKATSASPILVNHLNIAVCHARLGEFQEAICVLKDALERWPNDPRLQENLENIKRDAQREQARPQVQRKPESMEPGDQSQPASSWSPPKRWWQFWK